MRHPYESQTAAKERALKRWHASFGPKAAKLAVQIPHATKRPTSKPASAAAHSIPEAPDQSYRTDNDFLFGTEDPEALRCPFGSHIRRANPRDSWILVLRIKSTSATGTASSVSGGPSKLRSRACCSCA